MVKKKIKDKPIENGRGENGKFAKGHNFSAGKHNSALVAKARELKSALLNAISCKDIQEIAKKLVSKAKKGDVPATKEILDRCLGKPEQTHNMEGELAFRLILGEPKSESKDR